MKKKLLALVLAASLGLSLAACGGSADNSNSNSNDQPSSGTSEDTQQPADSGDAATVTWPDGKDVYVDVPSRAGGGTDILVRYLTTPWTGLIDGNIVVNNYDTMEVGTQHAANAKPDGLTLTISSTVNMDNYLTGASEVNPVDDLTVVAKFTAGGPQVVIARADAPYSNLVELADYAKPMYRMQGIHRDSLPPEKEAEL